MILKFFKTKNKFLIEHKYYTFKRSEHEPVYIKKLEDNKIFYNNYIYDENFFYYDKLNALFEHINQYRDEWLKDKFNRYFLTFYQKKIDKRLILRVIDFELDSNGECKGLTEEQYNWVVAAYSYNIVYDKPDYFKGGIVYHHGQLLKDLIPTWLYVNGWLAIKPVYGVFSPAKYKFYNDNDRVYKDLTFRKVNYGFQPKKSDELLPEEELERLDKVYARDPDKPFWDETGYKIDSDHRSLWWSDEKILDGWWDKWNKIDTNNTFFMEQESKLTENEDFYNPIYNPLNEGSRVRAEWLEYDEQKKYDEFDLNCKTNTYHMRYKFYNEVPWKDYPEDKKCSTEVITYDFTEKEIKANFENMMCKTKTAKEKWDFVVMNPKTCDALFDFLRKLEFLDLKYSRYFSNLMGARKRNGWYLMTLWNYPIVEVERDFEIIRHTYEKLGQDKIYQFLNDPRYILIMPLLDAFFEIFRKKGWWEGDKTFSEIPIDKSYLSVELQTVCRVKKYFELSLEHQDYLATSDCWHSQDFSDQVVEEYVGDILHYTIPFCIFAIILYYFLFTFVLYYGAYWAPVHELPINNLFAQFDYQIVKQFYLFDRPRSDALRLERKGPRNFLPNGRRLRRNFARVHHPWAWKWRWRKFTPSGWRRNKMPFKFDTQVSLNYWNFHGKKGLVYPLEYMIQIAAFMERDEALLNSISDEIAMFGRKTAISIYHVDGTLRVRWYMKVYEYFKAIYDKKIEEFLKYLEYQKERFIERSGLNPKAISSQKAAQLHIFYMILAGVIAFILLYCLLIVFIFVFVGPKV